MDWESRKGEQHKSCSYIVINGKTESHFFKEHSFLKGEEVSMMIQPKEQRYRFYKVLYKKNG